MGVSRFKTDIKPKVKLSDLSMGARDLILKKKICNFAKSATRSKVHRPAYCDYVLLKEFDEHGEVAVEHRFSGLYTSSVYFQEVLDIPLVRQKVNGVLERSGFAKMDTTLKTYCKLSMCFPEMSYFRSAESVAAHIDRDNPNTGST